MVRKFLREQRRNWYANRILRSGDDLHVLYGEQGELRAVGLADQRLNDEIERRERRHNSLLDKFKEAA